ncbi:MAG: PD-(D/E)XK nuclease family protein, partial [Bacteroidales bacterium]|nr:PD-(D/E)XK nuclease family protein [Bacteroidales bacterium]
QSLKNKILLTFEDTTINVSLNGISDRIDSHDGITCIVDYKTGKVEEKELKVSTIEELFDGNHDKAFQLMFYAYLYYSVNHKTPLQAQIISFRNLHQTLFLHINENKLLTDEMFVVFESLLKQHLSLLFDITHMFTQTTAVENCKWCDYQSLCMRE